MNGQMMNYKRYLDSLDNTPEPKEVDKKYEIDYKAMVAYAHEKGVRPCDLSEAEKQMFIIPKVAIV